MPEPIRRTTARVLPVNVEGEVLLLQDQDPAHPGVLRWISIGGAVDDGESLVEAALRELREETGIEAEPVSVLAIFDGMRLGFHSIPLYSLIFHCRMTGGSLKPHPLECLDVGFFPKDNLPEPLAGSGQWVDMAFEAIQGRQKETYFDRPRDPTWRSRSGEEG